MIQRGDAGLLWAAGWKLHPGEAAGMSRCEDINFPPWQMALMGDTVYKQREHAAFHYLWAWQPRWNGSADNSESFYCKWTQRARLQAPQKHDTGTRGKAMTHFCRNCALQGEINHLLNRAVSAKAFKMTHFLQNSEHGDKIPVRKSWRLLLCWNMDTKREI